MENLEEKTFKFELKALTEEGTFEGYAAIFDTPDAMNEIIEKGAFTKTIKEKKKFPMLWYHDPREPIGIIEVEEDEKGLKVKGTFNLEVQLAREKYALMKQKAIRGLSIGFRTMKDLWDREMRHLRELKLYEVSPVTFQAHPMALVSNVKQWSEQKPYPNEHSARIKNPDLFDPDTWRRKKDGTIYGKIKVPITAAVIWGKLKGAAKPSDMPIPQAIRFPVENWTVTQAKKWLKDNNVKYEKFEPASKSFEGTIEFLEEIKSGKVISAANLKLINNAILALTALLKAAEPSDDTQKAKEKGIIPKSIGRLGQDEKPQKHFRYLEDLKIPKF